MSLSNPTSNFPKMTDQHQIYNNDFHKYYF